MPDESSIKAQICEIGRRLYWRGLIAASDGNISVRVGKDEIWTTPTGFSKGFLQPDMLVKVDLWGRRLEGTQQASSELKMHLVVYQQRPDVQAVVHAHPPYATAFAVTGAPLDEPILAEAVVNLGAIALAPYATPSTDEVPRSIAPLVVDHDVVLLANHGALTLGSDLTSAHFRMESLEFFAQLTAISRSLGQPRAIPAEQLDKLYRLRQGKP
ncbi:MAG: class II aldolase/adducin family protein [Bacillota bacterium]|jgi:L-fuculose-phosphate aldolase